MLSRRLAPSLAVLTLLVVVAHSPAGAQPYAFAGLSLPVGDFGDAYNAGFHLGGGYDHPLTPQSSVGVRGTFNRHNQDELPTGEEDDDGNPILADGHIQMIELLATGKLATPGGLFALAGLGFTIAGGESGGVDFDSETDFTAAIGGGYQLLRWEFSAVYHTVALEGGSADYVALSAGVRF